jgi:CRISP-associated protein Cas1
MDRSQARSPVTLQQLVGAAERLARKVPEISKEQWLGLVDEVRDRLAAQPFVALPLDAYTLDDGAKQRTITVARHPDRLLEEALLPCVTRRLEGLLSAATHGYRKGRSTLTAAIRASSALKKGNIHVAALDIADFYGSIDRTRLRDNLRSLFDEAMIEVIMALSAAPIMEQGQLKSTEKGLPLGRALSPVLSNLYLLALDTAMERGPWEYVRYADDLLILGSSEQERVEAETLVVEELSKLGLRLKAEKTRHHRFDGSPIQYLGHTLDDHSIYERVPEARLARIADKTVAGEAASAETDDGEESSCLRSHTLYVTEQSAYLRVEQGQVVVQRGEEHSAEIPLHRIDRILVMAGVGMSSGFITACITHNISVLFFVGKGRAYGSLVAEGMPNPLRLRAQYDLLANQERRTAVARAIVCAKIQAMIKRLQNVSQAAEQRARLRELLPKLQEAKNADALRGYEGLATKIYYEGYAKRLTRPGFEFHGRSKRPPRDPVNSLMSFAYSLVFGEMQTALLAHGLDPYPAVLHDLRRGHPALASDLSEPYRVLIADSFVVTLINEGRVIPNGFETQANGAVYMTRDTRRLVIEAYESYVSRPSGGPRGSVTPRVLIEAGARAMLRVVLGEAETLVLPPLPSISDSQHPPAAEACGGITAADAHQ